MYIIILTNLFIYWKFIILANIAHFQIKQFKWCVSNVWAIMHLDTHFLEFKFLDYDNVKPLKNKFSINSNLTSKTCFFIWYILKCIACVWFINHALNPFKMQHMNEISNLIFLDLLSIYFLTIRQIGKFCKVDWK
jgi:hypothetical protein